MSERVLSRESSERQTDRQRERESALAREESALKLWVSFAKEPKKRDYILQKRPTTRVSEREL